MQASTAYRLAMLENGYWPLLNDCKKAIETGWPSRRPDRSEVLSWDRSALLSTGMKIDGDLAVIDADITDGEMVNALASVLAERFPELFTKGLVRHAGGPKEAWIVRVEKPFGRLASRRWYRNGDPDDPATVKHRIECFGSRTTRQFGIDGPHSRGRNGEVLHVYQFDGGVSPANTARALLPVLPPAAFEMACNQFDATAETAGLLAIKERRKGCNGSPLRIFELDADTEIETLDWGVMTVAELESFVKAQHKGTNVSSSYLRCSGSFHDPVRQNKTSHSISWGRYGLCIHDFMTEANWHRRTRDPSARFEFLAQLRKRNPFK
jgi:hypothetical protein